MDEYHGAPGAPGSMTRTPDRNSGGNPAALDPETTVELLNRVKAGDNAARERLVARCIPPLRRWARGRLPSYARDMLDTDDLVQESVLAALGRIQGFEARREGALQRYLRQGLADRSKGEAR